MKLTYEDKVQIYEPIKQYVKKLSKNFGKTFLSEAT